MTQSYNFLNYLLDRILKVRARITLLLLELAFVLHSFLLQRLRLVGMVGRSFNHTPILPLRESISITSSRPVFPLSDKDENGYVENEIERELTN